VTSTDWHVLAAKAGDASSANAPTSDNRFEFIF